MFWKATVGGRKWRGRWRPRRGLRARQGGRRRRQGTWEVPCHLGLWPSTVTDKAIAQGSRKWHGKSDPLNRRSLIQERAREVNRLQKVLEGANIKLGSVASDVLGKSDRAMIEALIQGTKDPEVLAELARGRLKSKRLELERALQGMLLVIAYHLLKEGTTYNDLGHNYFDERDQEAVVKRITSRLERLGYEVTIKKVA